MRSRARLGRALRSGRLNQPRFRIVRAQARPAKAGVALAAVGVENLERGAPAGRSGPVAGDEHLGALPDDIPAEPDPRPTGQLQPDAGGLADGAVQPARGAVRPSGRRLQHDQGDAGPTSERGHSGETVREPGGARRARGQVDDEQVHRPARQQGAGDRQALLRVRRGQHDEHH